MAAFDLAVYYLASMVVMGTFSTIVVFLLQKTKGERYRTGRASSTGDMRWPMPWVREQELR